MRSPVPKLHLPKTWSASKTQGNQGNQGVAFTSPPAFSSAAAAIAADTEHLTSAMAGLVVSAPFENRIVKHIDLDAFSSNEVVNVVALPFKLKSVYNDDKSGKLDAMAMLLKSDEVEVLYDQDNTHAFILPPPNHNTIRLAHLKFPKSSSAELRGHGSILSGLEPRFLNCEEDFNEFILKLEGKDMKQKVQYRDYVFKDMYFNNANLNPGMTQGQKAAGSLTFWPVPSAHTIQGTGKPSIDGKTCIKYAAFVVACINGTETTIASDAIYAEKLNCLYESTLNKALEEGKKN